MTEVSTKALDPKRVDEEEKELEQYQPSWEERRWLHVISLFFLVTLLFVGLPLWYLTTSTQQESLWIEKINTVSQHAINVAVDVNFVAVPSVNIVWWMFTTMLSSNETVSLLSIIRLYYLTRIPSYRNATSSISSSPSPSDQPMPNAN